jgi:exodeoxyribonuclease VII small subunit
MSRKKEEAAELGSDFEASLAELESIVDALESEELSLSEMIARYEKGSALLVNCDRFLKSARKRLEIIAMREENENVLAQDGKLCQSPPPASPDYDHDDDSISLF